MVLIIRADGNETIGLGHIMRCLSVADAAKQKGARVLFVLADTKALPLVESRGYEASVLDSDYRNMESEYDNISEMVNDLGIDCNAVWLVDSYYMTEAYLKFLSKYGKVAVMDDLFAMDYPVDFVINYNIYGNMLRDLETKYPDRALLTGPEYAPVREQFLQMRQKIKRPFESTDGKKHILISTGGADSLHLAEKISEELLKTISDESVILDIVCGAMNPNKDALIKLEGDSNLKVRVHIDVKDMAGLMAQCAIAVTAAGSTVYELSALAVPFVTYYFVENQKLIAEYSEKIMGVVNAGDFSIDNSPMSVIVDEVRRLLSDDEYRQHVSDSVYNVVDGNGAARIADKLMLSLK